MMKELESVMNKDVLTVTGETLGQILERTSQGDREVIKSMEILYPGQTESRCSMAIWRPREPW